MKIYVNIYTLTPEPLYSLITYGAEVINANNERSVYSNNIIVAANDNSSQINTKITNDIIAKYEAEYGPLQPSDKIYILGCMLL